ncbi:Glutathione transport system permease protein GsiC [Hyphomicrobiales bacterium]|nr:Glutathione transport system permease protein GsiC [Hyphomicrobiales bacterium]CAH1690747.1 Glutathione transport system permease protein GsiC [Hyphomicrobiales bacterium]
MLSYIVKRLSHTVLVIIGISIVSFVFMQLSGDPAGLMLPQDAAEQQILELRHKLGLDEPIVFQYLSFIGNALQGDLGRSLFLKEPVIDLILERLPATVELALFSMLFALVVAVPIGILSALKRGTILDTASMVVALFGLSMPHFWLGIMMIMWFSVQLGWLPTSGRGSFLQIIMPAAALGISMVALFARLTRSTLLDVLNQDYVRTAHAKGLPEYAVVGRHALKNAMIPLVTMIGIEFGHLLGGAVIIETVFAWPGVGRLIVQAITDRDYPVVQGAVMLLAIVFVVVNLLVDITYAWLDPSISLRGVEQ